MPVDAAMMTSEFAAKINRLTSVADSMTALAGRLDQGARLVTEGTDETGKVSVVLDRAGLAETIRVRPEWQAAVPPLRLPSAIEGAYARGLSARMAAAAELPPRDVRSAVASAEVPVHRRTATSVPRDQLSRSFDRLSAEAWEQMAALQRNATPPLRRADAALRRRAT